MEVQTIEINESRVPIVNIWKGEPVTNSRILYRYMGLQHQQVKKIVKKAIKLAEKCDNNYERINIYSIGNSFYLNQYGFKYFIKAYNPHKKNKCQQLEEVFMGAFEILNEAMENFTIGKNLKIKSNVN